MLQGDRGKGCRRGRGSPFITLRVCGGVLMICVKVCQNETDFSSDSRRQLQYQSKDRKHRNNFIIATVSTISYCTSEQLVSVCGKVTFTSSFFFFFFFFFLGGGRTTSLPYASKYGKFPPFSCVISR